LNDKPLAGTKRQIIFEHEWRDDFVGEALTLEVDAFERLHAIEFYSARLGVVRWNAGTGIGTGRRWEEEEEVGRGLAGPRAAFLDGATHDVESLNIIEAVLTHFEGTDLAGVVRAAMKSPQLPHLIDADMVALFAPAPEPLPTQRAGVAQKLGRAMRGLLAS